MAEYLQSVHDIFASGVTNGHDPQPVQMLYSWDNAYVGEAEGPEGEQGTTHVASPVNVRCEFKGDDLYLLFDSPDGRLRTRRRPSWARPIWACRASWMNGMRRRMDPIS